MTKKSKEIHTLTQASDYLLDLFAEEEAEVCSLQPDVENCQRLLDFIDFFASPKVYRKLLTEYAEFLSLQQREELLQQAYEVFVHYVAVDLELAMRKLEVNQANAQKILKAFHQKENPDLMDLLLGDFKKFLSEKEVQEIENMKRTPY